MHDPMTRRALRLLGELYRQNGENSEVLDNMAEAAGFIPGTATYEAVVIHLERIGAWEEAADLPRGIAGATYHRITPTGMRMLREAGVSGV